MRSKLDLFLLKEKQMQNNSRKKTKTKQKQKKKLDGGFETAELDMLTQAC